MNKVKSFHFFLLIFFELKPFEIKSLIEIFNGRLIPYLKSMHIPDKLKLTHLTLQPHNEKCISLFRVIYDKFL